MTADLDADLSAAAARRAADDLLKTLERVPDGYVVIPHVERLWASVPEDERLTEREIRAKGHARFYDDKRVASLTDPAACEIAVRAVEYPGNKWMRCMGKVNEEGTGRCRRHGGPAPAPVNDPTRRKARIEELEAEVAELRRRLEGQT